MPSVGSDRTQGPDGPKASIRSPPEIAKGHITQNHRTDWGDANRQVDYFVSAGQVDYDSIYNTAIAPAFVSISPIKSSKHNSDSKPAAQQTYPTQELNPRHRDTTPQTIDGVEKPTPEETSMAPDSPPYYRKKEPSAGTWIKSGMPPLPPPAFVGPSKFHVEDVHSTHQDFSKDFHCEEAEPMPTGLTQDLSDLKTSDGTHTTNLLDSFELDVVGAEACGTSQLKSEGLDEYSSDYPPPKRVSTSPNPKANHSETRPARSNKKTKRKPKAVTAKLNGKAKAAPVGITHPTRLDILRGRGGLTNRHPGNMRFRDEARKLRAEYRDKDTTREEKFLLSQELAMRVRGYGGRFLERIDGLWYEIDEKDARKKASQVLREEKWD
eukprot:CAMPEP_0183742046 /NCGR_PEP_ID=MMETSP0737-20130205/63803_1 /TAXON_ID=385413 /ORGANISM="Thalassiosira miniscula, Strain CCMP1093" /LENGTH=379 /DNA_ID=CAMNT_0025977563 /DNA_START=123 /DNA_END=1262 /DNA_ORIENTATION=-